MSAWLIQLLLGQLRHLLTALGATLTTQGILTNDEAQAAVAAIVMLFSVAWSAWDKFNKKE